MLSKISRNFLLLYTKHAKWGSTHQKSIDSQRKRHSLLAGWQDKLNNEIRTKNTHKTYICIRHSCFIYSKFAAERYNLPKTTGEPQSTHNI